MGGDAINGKVEDGRFFLASHGELTEVSRGIFLSSRYHAISLFVTQPLAFLAAWKANAAKGATPRPS